MSSPGNSGCSRPYVRCTSNRRPASRMELKPDNSSLKVVSPDTDLHNVAGAIHTSVGLFIWRLRQVEAGSELSWPQMSALARLDLFGPTTSADLARAERISPQGIALTLTALANHGYVVRQADSSDGRRILLSVTSAGRAELSKRRDARNKTLVEALTQGFSLAELEYLLAVAPLVERLAHAVTL